MADDKSKQDQQGQQAPKPGDVRPFGGALAPDANKAGDDKATAEPSSPKTGGQGHDGPRQDETVPGGLYNVDGVVRNANGDEVKGYTVGDDGKIVKSGDAAK